MSLPISIGMLSTFMFQVIDTYFVGQLGAEQLAALSFSSTLYFLLVGLYIGLSVGVSIIVGKASGSGDREHVKKTSIIAIAVLLILAISISTLVILFIDQIFTFLGARDHVLGLIRAYTIPLAAGLPLLAAGLLMGSILRATGNITKPEVLMAIAGGVNLVFDYLLIFGRMGFPEYGIRGAAYATVLSWILIIFGMIILMGKDKLISFHNRSSQSAASILKQIFTLGSPTIATQMIGPLTLMYITYLIARESEMAVAAFGVAGRIEMLLMIGILGISTAMTPFIAQNLGANKQERIDEAIAFGGRASTYLGLVVAGLLFIFIKPLAGIFSDNVVVIESTANYFYIVGWSYILYGIYLITTSIFNGLQMPINSLRISLYKSFLFTVPLTLIGSIWGVNGIFLGLGVSNILAGIYATREMKKEFLRSNSTLAKVNVFQEYKKDIKKIFRVKA